MYKVQNQSEKRMSQLPGWLWPNSNILPPLYKKIWEAVRDEKSRAGVILSEVLVDTNKIFPLLLTSQLSTEVLGYIWGIANKKYAGQLTEQELYTVLALVALAQASYPFNSLEVLHLIRVPPIPNLNLSLLDANNQVKNEAKVFSTFESLAPSSSSSNFTTNSNVNFNSTSSNSMTHSNSIPKFGNRTNSLISSSADNLFNDGKSDVKNSSNCGFGVNFSAESRQTGIKNDSSDDFSEFQSAPLPTIPTIPMWDLKQGSAIGSRLANHNLGVKKPLEKLKKNPIKSQSYSTRNTGINSVSSKEIQLDDSQSTNHERNSISNLLTNEMQLIDGMQMNFGYREGNFERLTELFPKCSVKSQSKTVILKDTIIRNDPPKSTEISPKNFPNVEKSPKSDLETSKNLNVNKVSF